LEIILATSVAFAAALLMLPALPYRYGTAVDLIAGRRLEYRQLLGITYFAQERQSILSAYYQKYIGPLPDEKFWVVESSSVQVPKVLQPLLPAQPLPRYSAVRDAMIELNALLARQEAPGKPAGRLTHEARGAAIARTLAIVRISGESELAFDYVRELQRQFENKTGELGPSAFPTAEQYLSTVYSTD